MVSASPPARIIEATRKAMPPANEPVAVRTYPTTYGPRNPPRLPKELMSPIEAAAADSLKNAVGSAQKLGRYASAPAATKQKLKTASTVFSPAATLSPSAVPATSIGTAVCQRRSRVRSDDQPTRSIATSPHM